MRSIIQPIICLIVLSLPFFTAAQDAPLLCLDPLLNKSWVAEGTWENGGPFKQETSFAAELDGQLIVARSKGFTDLSQTTYGNRNFGIRYVDKATGKAAFVEYDVFGGKTAGTMTCLNNGVLYTYTYEGYSLADIWEQETDSTYLFTVGTYQGDTLQQIFLKTKFVLLSNE